MNLFFPLIVLIAFICSAWQQLSGPASEILPMDIMTKVIFESSESAVQLAIGLIGIMAFFLGLMKVAEQAGLLRLLARALSPILVKLFPQVPSDHPAQGAMVMNISANMLGLGNAATPFGIKAMKELETLNQKPGVATDAMIMFLAINTSSVTLIPTKVIALRAAAESTSAAAIIVPTLFATLISTLVAISLCLMMQARSKDKGESWLSLPSIIGLALFFSLIPLTISYGQTIAPWVVPSMTVFILLFGYMQKVSVYESFVEGAKEGVMVAVKILPYLVAILVAIGLFKASGAMDALIGWIAPITSKIGMPAEALPMALMRPLSGSGSLGVLGSILNDPMLGPDSHAGLLASTLMGSTETTFYVIAVYFGAVQIKKLRHALWVALLADLSAILASVFIVNLWFDL